MSFDKPVADLKKADGQAEECCQVCGAMPARRTTLRYHIGILILLLSQKDEGMLCRGCGTAWQRRISGRSMLLGWWSLPGLFWNWVSLFRNYVEQQRIDRLAEPVGAIDEPLPLGPKAFRRPGPLIVTLLVCSAGVGFLAFAVYVIATDPGASGTA